MSFTRKAYHEVNYWFRHYRVHNEMVANEDPEYSVYVRGRRRKHNLPDPWDDVCSCRQKTWKGKRRTQYRTEGRNAYQITIKYKCEKEGVRQPWFASSCDRKRKVFRHSDDLKSLEFLQHLEEKFRFQGIKIQEFWKAPDPETLVGFWHFKVYGDREKGVLRYVRKKCERYGKQMKVEYI